MPRRSFRVQKHFSQNISRKFISVLSVQILLQNESLFGTSRRLNRIKIEFLVHSFTSQFYKRILPFLTVALPFKYSIEYNWIELCEIQKRYKSIFASILLVCHPGFSKKHNICIRHYNFWPTDAKFMKFWNKNLQQIALKHKKNLRIITKKEIFWNCQNWHFVF